MRRWGVPLAVLMVTVALAVGAKVAFDQVSVGTPAQPRLTRVPPGTVAQWGIRLAPISSPPYCGVQQAAAGRGIGPDGLGGCPVSDGAAVTAAQRGGSGAVLEAQLARVTLTHSSQIARDQPAWIVVLRFQPGTMAAFGGCRPGSPGCSGAPGFGGETAQIVIVDAYSGRVLLDIPVMPNDGQHPGYKTAVSPNTVIDR
jgi:hypothetical protein